MLVPLVFVPELGVVNVSVKIEKKHKSIIVIALYNTECIQGHVIHHKSVVTAATLNAFKANHKSVATAQNLMLSQVSGYCPKLNAVKAMRSLVGGHFTNTECFQG